MNEEYLKLSSKFSAELQKYPESKLSLNKRSCFFDKVRKEYFIDRHRRTFEVIASYINNGKYFSSSVFFLPMTTTVLQLILISQANICYGLMTFRLTFSLLNCHFTIWVETQLKTF